MANFNNLPTKKRGGPSVFEVFVILVVIAVISVISFSMLSGGTSKSQNVSRAAQIKEYVKALEYYYTENGTYPESPGGAVCLGDYDDDSCWQEGEPVVESTTFTDGLVPTYLRQMPEGERLLFGKGSGNLYEGMIYKQRNDGGAFTIQYFMAGTDEDCLIADAKAQAVGEDTGCTLDFSP